MIDKIALCKMTLLENICVRENKQSSNEKNDEYYLIQTAKEMLKSRLYKKFNS